MSLTKYKLYDFSDAVPSIFYWNMDVNETKSPDEKVVPNMDKSNKNAQKATSLTNLNIQDTVQSSNDVISVEKSKSENVDKGKLKSPQKLPIDTSVIDVMLNEKSNDVKKITASFKKGLYNYNKIDLMKKISTIIVYYLAISCVVI